MGGMNKHFIQMWMHTSEGHIATRLPCDSYA